MIIGFIGTGNMGYPMLKGAVSAFGAEEVCFYDASPERRAFVKEETGASPMEDNKTLAASCRFVVLAVKPYVYPAVMEEIKEALGADTIVITIAAGVAIQQSKEALGAQRRIIRAMPNTPAMVKEGMTGICYSKDEFAEEEKQLANAFFSAFGKVEVFEEKLMDAVVCANGSSPAYVYMFIEALADSVVKYGIPRDKAYVLTAQTVRGAAKMVLETGEHPGALKDKVCTPGGTTIAGVAALEEYGMRNAVIKATDACYEKAASMHKK